MRLVDQSLDLPTSLSTRFWPVSVVIMSVVTGCHGDAERTIGDLAETGADSQTRGLDDSSDAYSGTGDQGQSVVHITLDTFGLQGFLNSDGSFNSEKLPNLVKFASEGLASFHHRTVGDWTYFGATAEGTGKFISEWDPGSLQRKDEDYNFQVSDDMIFLTEVLPDEIATIYLCANKVACGGEDSYNNAQGYDEVISGYEDNADGMDRLSSDLTDYMKSMEKAGLPYYAHLNWFISHEPYNDFDADCAQQVNDLYPTCVYNTEGNSTDENDKLGTSQYNNRVDDPSTAQLEACVAYYDAAFNCEQEKIDFYFGKLSDLIKERGVGKKTIFIISADHGEGELAIASDGSYLNIGSAGPIGANRLGHFNGVSNAETQSFIFFKGYGIPNGVVLENSTSQVDVFPTILAFLGQDLSLYDGQGSPIYDPQNPDQEQNPDQVIESFHCSPDPNEKRRGFLAEKRGSGDDNLTYVYYTEAYNFDGSLKDQARHELTRRDGDPYDNLYGQVDVPPDLAASIQNQKSATEGFCQP